MRCVEAFLSALRRAEQIGAGLDIGWLERELGGMAMESPGDVDAVRIMTLHKAKGLEFDTVLMPYLHKRTRGLQGDLIRWHWHHKTQPPGLLIAANDEIKTSDSLYNYLSFLQKKKDREELKRLLYVGITRAKCQCILSGTLEWEGDNPPPKPPAGSLLEVLLEGAGVNKTKVITNADLIPVETPLLSDTMAGAEGRGRLAQARLRSGEYAPELSTGRQLAEPLHADEHRTERLIGTITHRVLELLASAETLPMPDDPQIAVWIERNTQRLVLGPDRTQIICQRVQWLVAQTLSCDIGQWILSSHPDSGVEMSLSCIEEGEVKRYVIDRTFLNVSDGIRWVIDYKTGEPAAGEDLSAFEARQTELYQGQLHQYAHLLERYFASSEAPIKTALYFPATQRLVECS
jgi:ATP-dependent exoDNAse (exonuclease V) beta subunit